MLMRKREKHIITLKEALEKIPHNEFYCNDSGVCPYFRLRKLTRSKMLRIARSKDWFGIPSYYYKNNQLEYCVFLQDWLWVQDGCKDCCINEDYYDEDDKLISRRITNREAADEYKERFPEESDLIDKIVQEDHLEYWHKDKENN